MTFNGLVAYYSGVFILLDVNVREQLRPIIY